MSLSSEVRALLEGEGLPQEEQTEELSRTRFLKWLNEFRDELREAINPDVTLPKEGQEERIINAANDPEFFAQTYFEHHLKHPEPCEMHQHINDVGCEIVSDDIGRNYALAAPRGHAKTTRAYILVLWMMMRKNLPEQYAKQLKPMRKVLKHYICYVSDAVELSEVIGEIIKVELIDNPNLAFDFPHACGVGPSWKIGEFVSRSGVMFKAFGSDKAIRGRRFGNHRPDFVIIDDFENDINVKNQKQRDKGEDIIDNAIAFLGDIEGNIDCLMIGTVLHRDSVLARKLKKKSWHPRIFKALEKFPERMDLWEVFRQILDSKGPDAARSFYKMRKKEMEKGARLLWRAKPLWRLMQDYFDTPKAFAKELQNDPKAAGGKFSQELLDNACIKRHDAPKKYDKVIGAIDHAGEGKCEQGVAVVGSHTSDIKRAYVAYTKEYKLSDKLIIEEMIRLTLLYKIDIWVGDKNGGWGILLKWFKAECQKRNIDVMIKAINHTTDKKERIGDLEMRYAEEEIKHIGKQDTLSDQLLDLEDSDLLDVADAAEMAITRVLKGTSRRGDAHQDSQRQKRRQTGKMARRDRRQR